MADKHGITPIPGYIPAHLNVEAKYLSWGKLVSKWHVIPCIMKITFQLWSQLEVDLLASSCTFNSGATTASRRFGVECILPSMEVSGKFCLSSSSNNSSSTVHVSSGTCHKSVQTSYSSGTMLDGGSLASHSSQHIRECCSSVLHC